MHKQSIRSVLHRIPVYVVALTMVSILLLPLLVQAEASTPESVMPPDQITTPTPEPESHIPNTPPETAASINTENSSQQKSSTTQDVPPPLPALNMSIPQANASVTANTPTAQTNTQTDAPVNNTTGLQATSGNGSGEQNTTVRNVQTGNIATIDHVNKIAQLDESVSESETTKTTADSDHDTISLQTDKDEVESQEFHWWLPFILLLAILLAGRYYIVRRQEAREDIKEEI